MKREKMVRIYIRMPASLKEAIRRLAKEDGISMSEWIRRAIDHHLREKGYK